MNNRYITLDSIINKTFKTKKDKLIFEREAEKVKKEYKECVKVFKAIEKFQKKCFPMDVGKNCPYCNRNFKTGNKT